MIFYCAKLCHAGPIKAMTLTVVYIKDTNISKQQQCLKSKVTLSWIFISKECCSCYRSRNALCKQFVLSICSLQLIRCVLFVAKHLGKHKICRDVLFCHCKLTPANITCQVNEVGRLAVLSSQRVM